jgi:hypothetical protein
MSDWDYQNPRLVVAKLLLPVVVWLVAALLPLVPIIRDPVPADAQLYLLFGLILATSFYWGIRGRRHGSKMTFRVLIVIPLALLGLSTVASLSIALARLLSHA